MTLEAPTRRQFIEHAPKLTPAQIIAAWIVLACWLGLYGFAFVYIVMTGRAW